MATVLEVIQGPTMRARGSRRSPAPSPSRSGSRRHAPAFVARRLAAALAILVAGCCSAAEKPEPAGLKISGYGLLGSRDLRRMLLLAEKGGQPPQYFDANFVEDAALLITTRLIREGYLKPRLTGSLTLVDGTSITRTWQEDELPTLPRPLSVRQLHFRIERGKLYYYEKLEFRGLNALPAVQARRFFLAADSLIWPKTSRIYTPARLQQSIESLAAALDRKGLGAAKVGIEDLVVDHTRGAVQVSVAVEEVPVAKVRSVKTEIDPPDGELGVAARSLEADTVYSQDWKRDFEQQLQVGQYRAGYPDATVGLSVTRRERVSDAEQLDLLAKVDRGSFVEVGRLGFEGNDHTKESVLRRRVKVVEDAPLNRVQIEQDRYRLFRMGIFDSVRVRYDELDEATRDVTFELQEGKRREFSLLLGYGSYELLRGGIEWQQRNVFGLAHTSRLRLVQSFKASSADYAYTMPELLGEGWDGFVTGTGLRREEPSFMREEYGGATGVRRHFPSIATDASIRYNYEFLNAEHPDFILPDSVQRSRVSSLITDFKHDRRDHPLYPRQGYHVFTTVELASPALGGQADFQRLELSGSWHMDLGGGALLHLGLSHGVDLTLGGADGNLPFNKRFLPGGENSVRGYAQGEASPRDQRGNFVGAETFLEGHLELEQSLTSAWSLVAFLDGVGFARDLRDYPADTGLYSVGGGVRWRTLLGPVRLEYGHNLNPRPHDPAGTLHFSIGFPF